MQLLVDLGGGGEPVLSQLGQLVLQVRTANGQKEPLALLQDLVQLGLMLCQVGLQTLEDRGEVRRII